MILRFINRYPLITVALTIAAVSTVLLRAQSPAPSDDYYASLVQYEGRSLIAYEDNGKQWTVGIGHRLCALNDSSLAQLTYSTEEVKVFYDNDLEQALSFLRRDEPQFDSLPLNARLVMVHLVWTNGIKGYRSWHQFRAAVHQRNWRVAANELRSSKWWWQVSRSRREWMVSLLATAATQH